MQAVVSNVERLATYDGPGLRTVIYFKGCPLRCTWCSNPETQQLKPQIMVDHHKCISCQRCVNTCPAGAISYDKKIKVDFSKCDGCEQCLSNCPTGSLKLNGKKFDLDQVIELVLKDKTYYDSSGGGLTVSGGEMLMHGDFVFELFKLAHQNRVNTAIETCGYGNTEIFKNIISECDHVMFDYKLPTSLYEKYTGKKNDIIKSNLAYALSQKDVLVRVPIVPGVNDNLIIVGEIIQELKKMGVKRVEALKYHRFGISKYEALNLEYPIKKDVKLIDENYQLIKEEFKKNFN